MAKVKQRKLNINERPRFGAYNAIIQTSIDKEKSRQKQKLRTKQALNELD